MENTEGRNRPERAIPGRENGLSPGCDNRPKRRQISQEVLDHLPSELHRVVALEHFIKTGQWVLVNDPPSSNTTPVTSQSGEKRKRISDHDFENEQSESSPAGSMA